MKIKFSGKSLALATLVVLGSATASFAATAYATTTLNVRTGPGPGYGAIDVLQRGERVEVERCRGSWCFVSKRGPDGWVSASYLSRNGYYDDYYDDYDDDFYIERPRKRSFPFPRSSICFGNPNASFCVSD